MLRILLYLFGIPLLLVLAVALLLPLFLDEERLLALAADTLEEKTGAQLTVNGGAEFSLLPRIGLQLAQAELALPGENQPDLSVRSLAIGVKLLPLFSRSVEIDGLTLEGLLVNLPAPAEPPQRASEGLSDAELDAFYAARRQALAEAGQKAGARDALALPMALEVDKLRVLDSRIVLLGRGNEAPTIIDLELLRATDLNLDGLPVPVKLALRMASGDGGDPVRLEMETRFTLDADAQMLQLADLTAGISGITAEPIQLAASGSADLQRLAADLALTLDIGAASGEGKVRYASFESPQIDANLQFNQLSPALLALAGPAAAQKRDSDDAGSTGDEPLPLAALRSIDSRVALRVDSARFDAHEITDLRTQLRLVDGVLRINRLEGKLHGGELDMVATLNAGHNTAKLATRGALNNVDLPRLLSALDAEPILTGSASLDWKLASEGRTRNALRDKLNGPLGLHTRDLVLQGLGIERMLCEAVALVNREALQAELPTDSAFQALTLDVALAGGKARLAPLNAELQHVKLTGEGDLELASLDFDADFAARLSPELASLDPACRVNERYTAIAWPLACEGNLGGEPADWCRVNTSEIVEDLTKQEVQRKVEKEAGKLLNKFLERD